MGSWERGPGPGTPAGRTWGPTPQSAWGCDRHEGTRRRSVRGTLLGVGDDADDDDRTGLPDQAAGGGDLPVLEPVDHTTAGAGVRGRDARGGRPRGQGGGRGHRGAREA